MNYLSNRINQLSESETLAMSKKTAELKAQGMNVINLSIGEPDFDTPLFVKNAAKKALDENFTHYTPVSGYRELREAVCNKLRRDNGLNYTPEQIVVSTGAKQAIANTMLCLVNPGDEVIVPSPYWVSYKEIVKMAEGTAVYIHGHIENDFKITAAQLEQAISPRTKVFIFSSPCNPTGSVYSREELASLAAVFAKNPHVFIISDEIYEYIRFSGEHASLASFSEIHDRVILVNGVSKGYAMTGWRVGFIAANCVIAKACDKLQGQFTSGTCSIAQRATIDALNADPATSPELQQMVSAFRSRRDLVLSLLAEIPGVRTNKPEGAFYVFANVSAYLGKSDGKTSINDTNDLCMYLLEKAGVAMVGGAAFGDPECIRLSYATSEDLLRDAVARMARALEALH